MLTQGSFEKQQRGCGITYNILSILWDALSEWSQENDHITFGKNILADYDFDIIKGSVLCCREQQYKALWDCMGVNYSKTFHSLVIYFNVLYQPNAKAKKKVKSRCLQVCTPDYFTFNGLQ